MRLIAEHHKRKIIHHTTWYLQSKKLIEEIRFLSQCQDIEILQYSEEELSDRLRATDNHIWLYFHPICSPEAHNLCFTEDEGAPNEFFYSIENAFEVGTVEYFRLMVFSGQVAARQDFGISIDDPDEHGIPRIFPEMIVSMWPEMDWKANLQLLLENPDAPDRASLNQGVRIKDGKILEWERLNFRSREETKIAEALDHANVLFLPNCAARLGSATYRTKLEADFIVCHSGKWGILEVSGRKHHTPQTRPDEASRERLFKAHGVRVVESYTAEECRKDPDGVVSGFLKLLAQNG